MARRKRKHANVRVLELRATLLLHREQAVEKGRDIRDDKSDTRVSNNGPTQAQSINGIL